MFSPREIAVLIWTAALLVYALQTAAVRKSIVRVVRSALKWKLVVPVVVLLGYSTACLWLLAQFGLWGPELMKETVVWFAGAIALVYGWAATDSGGSYWSQALSKTLTLTLCIELLLSKLTFPFIAELFLVPIATTLMILNFAAQADEKNKDAAKLISGLITAVGVIIVSYAGWRLYSEWDLLDKTSLLRELALGPYLFFLIAPFAFAFSLLVSYEQAWLRVGWNPDVDRRHKRTLQLYLVRRVGMNLSRLRQLVRTKAYELTRVRSQEDIDLLLRGMDLAHD